MALKGNLADSFKLVCFQIVYYLVKCTPSRPQQMRLLLVKTDEIGDYVLARHFFGKFREAGPYCDHSICLVANKLCKPLYDAYDAGAADEVIWLDKPRFRRSMFYRWSVLKKIRSRGFSDAVNLCYSRSFRYDDALIAVSTAKNRLAMSSVSLPVPRLEARLIPDHIYTKLIDAGDERSFDACKNRLFVGQLLQREVGPATTSMPVSEAVPPGLPPAYFVIFPGSGDPIRRWPTAHFVAVARYLADHAGFEPVVCGSAGDKEAADLFVGAYGRPLVDLTGKTSLTGLLALLKGSRCLISVDTGAVHMAAAVGCPVFGLFSGLYYGRFAPYPPEIAPAFVAFYPAEIQEMIDKGEDWDVNVVPIDLLRKITPEVVIDKLSKFFVAEIR
jgi:ADP-heptose:LPS heptosyltransferase